jgi:hypothetical protein
MIRTFSFGGGVQSMAALVLAAEGKLKYDAFLFCNVGEDSEHPATLEYFRDYAQPFAAGASIPLHELRRNVSGGDVRTLYQKLTDPEDKADIIPFFLDRTGARSERACTSEFKIRVVAKWLKAAGATKADPASTALGISMDEYHRMRSNSGIAWQTLEYPLVDLRLHRQDCRNIIERAGLPIPPKSACWFCPFHTRAGWQKMKDHDPDLFAKACDLEATVNEKRARRGKEPVRLTRHRMPLAETVRDGLQLEFSDTDLGMCESGYCMT